MSLIGANLEAFLSVVKHQSVTHAAKELRITQTGVTQRIKGLERELNTTLFLRSRRGMALTESGLTLLRYCESFKNQEAEFLSSIHGAGNEHIQRISIAGPSSVLRSRLIQSVTSIIQKYPNLRFSFDLTDTVSALDKLRQGGADLVIVRPDEVVNELDSKFLKPEKYVLVGPKKWKNRKLKDILATETIIDFDAQDRMTIDYLKKFDLLHLWKGERHFANNTDALAELVSAGLGFSVLALDFAERCLAKDTLILLNEKKAYEYPLALAWYPRPHMPSWFKEVLNKMTGA